MKLDSHRVLYEDNHIIAVNKLPGELSQGDETGDRTLGDLVKDYIKEKYSKPGNVFLGVVHRLDRPVSGVILFARTGKALERLTGLIRERDIQKTYWAVVKQKPPKVHDELIHFLERIESKRISKAYSSPRSEAKEAKLVYKLMKEKNGFYLLEVLPETGRHHQIRVQLAAIGCPIVGDLKYGYPEPLPDASIALHARKLEFIHPIKKERIVIEASPPSRVWTRFSS